MDEESLGEFKVMVRNSTTARRIRGDCDVVGSYLTVATLRVQRRMGQQTVFVVKKEGTAVPVSLSKNI